MHFQHLIQVTAICGALSVSAAPLSARSDNTGPIKEDPIEPPWYKDIAAGIAEGITSRTVPIHEDPIEPPWYKDIAAGVSEGITARSVPIHEDPIEPPWYKDIAAGVAEGITSRTVPIHKNPIEPPWYKDIAAGAAAGITSRSEGTVPIKEDPIEPPWYKDIAAGVSEDIKKRDAEEDLNANIRAYVFGNMRRENLRETSEKGKALFQFEVKPRSDVVDRWHIPKSLQSRYDKTNSDADRVSVLNLYLMLTGREVRSAADLGFTPTASKPGLVELNEVGYGYAFASQHQSHCVDSIANAIELGKANINDFYLVHVIHCLGLLKYYAPRLTQKEPLIMLTAAAEERLRAGYKPSDS